VERVQYFAGRRRLGSARRAPFRIDVRRGRLPSGRKVRLRARVSTRDGRAVTLDRLVVGCRR
jgi:hypothetical protein